jgi:hypothetical protein
VDVSPDGGCAARPRSPWLVNGGEVISIIVTNPGAERAEPSGSESESGNVEAESRFQSVCGAVVLVLVA